MASLLTTAALFSLILGTNADFRFATSYGTHMVLQQAPLQAVVWGYCDEAVCSNVDVSVKTSHGDLVATINAQPGGISNSWIVKLPAVPGSNTAHSVTATDGTATITIDDVLFGDVWVCSGQSNMAFLLENAFNGSDFVKDADNHPMVRLFTSKKKNSRVPLDEQSTVEEPWTISNHTSVTDDGCPHCNSTNDGGVGTGDDNWLYMSAVCYMFGLQVQKHTNLPVGLVNTNWGGTPVEFWMSEDAESKCVQQPTHNQTVAGGAYNGMIKPLLNMTIYGAIWYQGEANQGDAFIEQDPQGLPMVSYGCRFPSMIQDWRSKWSEGTMQATNSEFPFGFVQLAPWVQAANGPAGVRWGQTAGYGYVPNPAMPSVFDAIAIDLTDRTSPFGSVHIRDKKTVSERLGLGGLAVAYDQNVYWQGPYAVSATISSSSVIVTFNNTGKSGIDLQYPVGFETCTLGGQLNCSTNSSTNNGEGGWTAATATQSSSNAVEISLDATTKQDVMAGGTLLVRYAWDAVPFEYKNASIYSKTESLPAAPFVLIAH